MQDEEKIISLLRDEEAPALGEVAAKRVAANATTEFIRTQPARGGFLAGLRARLVASGRGRALAGGFALAMALAVIVWQGSGDVVQPKDKLERQKVLLAEFNEMFNGKLQAVISVNGETKIVLGETSAERGTPVAISLVVDGKKVEIVSFSGQNVKLSLGGREVSFDALDDGRGGVILAGDRIFWTSHKGEARQAPGLKINAQLLEM